jgi:hypothetical protein
MKQNLGLADRLLRLVLGVGFLAVGVSTGSGIAVIGGLFSIYEAVASWCVFYQLIGRNTCPLPSARRHLELLELLMQGLVIFIVALLMNILATFLQWESWYTFLQNPKTLSLDNYLFLFIVYPLGLGLSARYGKLPK